MCVSILAASQPKAKRKISESTDKRDKKATKDKKRTGSKSANSPIRSTTPPLRSAPASFTDVIADNLIQNAQKAIEPPLSVKKAQRNNGTADGFDIPSISEITTKPSATSKITELADLQRQIEEAKRQLNISATGGESDDEDFINLRTDRNDLDGDVDLDSTSHDSNSNDKAKANRKDTESEKTVRKTHNRIVFDDKDDNKGDSNNASSNQKHSVLNRLGMRHQTEEVDKPERNDNIISLSAHRRMEQAIYVAPAQRSQSSSIVRNEKTTSAVVRSTVRDRSTDRSTRESRNERSTRDTPRGRDTNEPADLRERVRQKNRDLEIRRSRTENRSAERTNVRSSSRTASTHGRNERSPAKQSPAKPTLASRIGSKVIVAKHNDDYSEEEIVVPVNSVIKVKPRPIVPKSKQASKNLLLRAVAEAQKSTALVKPNAFEAKVSGVAEKKELYTKSFRKNLNKDNIVVEIASSRANTVIDVDDMDLAENDDDGDDEYVPTSLSLDEDPIVYIPQVINSTLHSR